MPRQFFGTDGIRGVPGTAPLDDSTLFALGRSVAEYLHKDHSSPHALIGTDTRESGPHIASVVAAGLAKGGASVSFAGVLTTPSVACLVRQNDFHVGVVVSASHNPYQDTGVRSFSHEGMKFPDSVEEEIENGILAHRAENVSFSLPQLRPDDSLHHQYLKFLRDRVISGASLKGLRVVLDCANGAAFQLGPELFNSLGCDLIFIGTEPDGRNINANCGSLHLERLQQRVPTEKAAF